MARQHILNSAGYWFNASRLETDASTKYLALEQAYNHLENCLSFLANKYPEVKKELLKQNTGNITKKA